MSCPTRPGPSAYVTYVESLTGHKLTAGDWHAIKDLAAAAGYEGAHSRKHVNASAAQDAATSLMQSLTPVPDFQRVRDEYTILTKRLDEINDIKNPDAVQQLAADVTRSRVRTLKRRLTGLQRQRDALSLAIDNATHTAGNIAVIQYLSDHGVSASLAQVRGDNADDKQRDADITVCEDISPDMRADVLTKVQDRFSDAFDGYAFIGGYCYVIEKPEPSSDRGQAVRRVHVFDSWGEDVHLTVETAGRSLEDALTSVLETDDEYDARTTLFSHNLLVRDVIHKHAHRT